MRVLAMALVALFPAACSLPEMAMPRHAAQAGPAPSYRVLIAKELRRVVGDPVRAGAMQISGYREVDSVYGRAWLVCLNTNVDTRPLGHAVFIQNERIVESRIAVRADHCEEQAYEPFGVAAASQAAIR